MEKALNISIIAPRGTGKTTLIGALYDYVSTEIQDGKGLKFEVPREYKGKLEEIRASVKNFSKTLIPTYGTNEVEKFGFRYIIDGDKININFMDIPGGFVEKIQFGSSNPDYIRFFEHFEQSPILVIPIDTPCLAEEEKPGQSAAALDIYNIYCAVRTWMQYRSKMGGRATLHFVMLKSEIYSFENKLKQCFEKFLETYKEVLSVAWSEQPNKLEIKCTPVEIFGNIVLDRNGSKWVNNNLYEEKFQAINRPLSGEGFSALWDTIEDFVEFLLYN